MAHAQVTVPAASDYSVGLAQSPFGDYVAVGGGYVIERADVQDVQIIESTPSSLVGQHDGTRPSIWEVAIRNQTGHPLNGRSITVQIWVSCASGNPRIG